MNSPRSALCGARAERMFFRALYVFLGGLLFLYGQVLFMPALGIAGVVPLILLPWLIYIVWKESWGISLPVVFVIGLMYDTLNPALFGMHALFFVLLAVLIDVLRIPFEQDSLVAKLIAISSTNFVYSLLSLLAIGLAWGFDAKAYSVSIGGFIYNLIFSLLVFGIMQVASKLRVLLVHD
jgi:rod shape-determining protein MreD